jgi:hypothetical protein
VGFLLHYARILYNTVCEFTRILVENSSFIIADKYERGLKTPMESCLDGRAVAQRLVAGFPPRGPGSHPGSMWGLWWTKQYWSRFSPRTSVSPANHHSSNFSIIIITRGWHNRPIGGRSAEWTKLDSTPPPTIPI